MKRREAGAGDHAEVDVAGPTHDPVLEHTRRLVHHRMHGAVADVCGADVATLRWDRSAERLVDLLVAPLLAIVLVHVEALAALAAEQLRVLESDEWRCGR